MVNSFYTAFGIDPQSPYSAKKLLTQTYDGRGIVPSSGSSASQRVVELLKPHDDHRYVIPRPPPEGLVRDEPRHVLPPQVPQVGHVLVRVHVGAVLRRGVEPLVHVRHDLLARHDVPQTVAREEDELVLGTEGEALHLDLARDGRLREAVADGAAEAQVPNPPDLAVVVVLDPLPHGEDASLLPLVVRLVVPGEVDGAAGPAEDAPAVADVGREEGPAAG
ncbi:hypothetical protein THAOC_30920, partial [Thalassiosira oceanica]